MEERKDIKLKAGLVGLGSQLGPYYIDMRPALIHYTQNIYGGDFDVNGVPRVNGANGLYYSPVNICQYGFMLHAEYWESKEDSILKKLDACTNKLIELQSETEAYVVWWHNYDELKYGIKSPWASAMAQGEAISFYLRMYQINNKPELLRYAQKAYQFMSISVDEGGVRVYDENGYLWLEEYPSKPSSYVLNGFIYALWGLYDLFRVTQDEKVKADIDACVKTLKANIHQFDAGYWSYYDLLKKELVRYYYQLNVHAPQMDVMYKLTGLDIFEKYRKKWEATINPSNYLFVKMMYRILPRWRKKSLKA